MRPVSLILLLICSILCFNGQESVASYTGPVTVEVQGILIDQDTGEPLSGAAIRVVGTDIIVYSGFEGDFSLQSLPAGIQEIEISFISYRKKIIRELKPGHVGSIRLQKDKTKSLSVQFLRQDLAA